MVTEKYYVQYRTSTRRAKGTFRFLEFLSNCFFQFPTYALLGIGTVFTVFNYAILN